MATYISHSPEATEALGAQFGLAARSGQVIALSGDLGAGKTQFVRGVARGLGTPGRVHSPTFTLVNEYGGGRLKLFHLDLYRLETPEQILEAGIGELFPPEGLAVIEWAERLAAGHWPQMVTKDWRPVKIEVSGDSERTIFYDDPGV
jgi:tRNA threonylcarbamoyladenosine biosynthesis protein TsaE